MLLMFIISCYFIQNACTNTAAEKEFDIINTDDTGAHSSSEIQEKRNSQQRHIKVTKRANSSGRIIQLRAYFDMK